MSKDINMPKRVVFPPETKKSKNMKFRYLRYGFEQLGIPIVNSPGLLRDIIKSEIYPFYLIYRDKREVRILLDVVASKFKKHIDQLGDTDHYFKTHMAIEDAELHPRMHPMPQATSSLKILRELQSLRRTRRKKSHLYDIVAVFINSDAGLRQLAVEVIRKQDWKSKAHMIVSPKLERQPVPKELTGDKLPYIEHLKLQSKSLLSLALPGARLNQGASCSFRHAEIWAMGGCVLTIKPGTIYVGDPKDCTIEFNPDLSDFVDIVNDCIENPEKCERVAANGLRYFNKYISPEAHAMHVIRETQG